jgi:hypothetical protein
MSTAPRELLPVTIPDGTTQLKGRNGWMAHPTTITGRVNPTMYPTGDTRLCGRVRLQGRAKGSGWNSPWQLETTSPAVLRDLARLCTHLADELEEMQAPGTQANNARLRDLARDAHQEDGTCEIDGDAQVSLSSDDGAYVQAWVWVTDPQRLDEDTTTKEGDRA